MRSIIGALIGLPIVAAIAVPIERRFAGRAQRVLRGGWITDVCYFVTRPLLQIAGLVAGLALVLAGLLAILPAVLLRPAVMAQPMWLLGVETFVLFDLLAYWAHRLLHEVPFLWRFHAVHHSSRDVDWLAAVRDHPVDRAVVFLPAAFLIVAGFPLVAVVASVTVWDVLFGTSFSPAGRRPAGFGCDEPVPESFTGQLSYPFRARRRQLATGPL